ncbi:hypothetical protein LBMAG53_06340 [Planctomycetota bacterium]|nr:hypothetical protein LBMAG53_06340 [Planctomycetota bacterium]
MLDVFAGFAEGIGSAEIQLHHELTIVFDPLALRISHQALAQKNTKLLSRDLHNRYILLELLPELIDHLVNCLDGLRIKTQRQVKSGLHSVQQGSVGLFDF